MKKTLFPLQGKFYLGGCTIGLHFITPYVMIFFPFGEILLFPNPIWEQTTRYYLMAFFRPYKITVKKFKFSGVKDFILFECAFA